MALWSEVAQGCYCCSHLSYAVRLGTPRRWSLTSHSCASSAQRRQARHRSKGKTKRPGIPTASAYTPQDVSTADPEVRPKLGLSFEGLEWIQQREQALRSEDDDHARPKSVPRTVDERDPRRHPYHRDLSAALSRKSVLEVEDTLQSMQEDDLEPGPLAYNTLVVAHIKTGNLDAALDVVQDLQFQGLQPIQQSYCALIHSSVRSGQLRLAEEVLHQMKESRISSYPGWLVLTKQLWAKGHTDLAQAYLRERQQDWQVDGDLYEHILRHVCLHPGDNAAYLLNPDFKHMGQHSDPQTDQPPHQEASAHDPVLPTAAAEESVLTLYGTIQKIWAYMQETQVPIEPRHSNIVLKHFATENIKMAEKVLAAVTSGQVAAFNAASFECLAEAYAAEDGGDLDGQLYALTKQMSELKLLPTNRMYSLSMEAALRSNNLEMALNKLKGMRDAGQGRMQSLSDSVLANLLWKLSCNNRPADLLRTLKAMQRDDKYFSAGAHNQQDGEGRSFLTAWLAAKPRASVQGYPGLANEPAKDITEIDGCRILRNKYILDESGKIVAPSNLKVPQLKAELKARQLSAEGKTADLKKRIKAARAADTTDLALEVQQRQDAKSLKLRKQAGKEEAKRLKHAQAVASGEDSKSNVTYQKWGSGGVLEQKEEEVKVEADAEEGVVVDEDEGETGMPEEPLQLLESAALREDNNERAEGSGNGDDDDQDALQSHVAVISAAAVPVQQTFTNQSAGVDAAMQLLRLTQSLQGTITAADYDTLLEAAEREGSANAAWSLVRSWRQTIDSAYDAETVTAFYNTALKVCKQAANPTLASEVLRSMDQDGIAVH